MPSSTAPDLWQIRLWPVSLKHKFREGKIPGEASHTKKSSLSAGYPELQTAWSWDRTLRKYGYFLVLFFLPFLGTGHQPLMETGHCRDGSFGWPSIAILMFLCGWKDPYFNSLSSRYHHANPYVNSLPLPEAFLTILSSYTSYTLVWPATISLCGICSCSEKEVTLGYTLLWQVLGIRL